MPAKRSSRISCYQAVKKSGLLQNLTQVAAGYRKAGMPGAAEVIVGVRKDARAGMTFSDMAEFQDKAHTVCIMAIFVLADLGVPEWIKRREAHLKKMEAGPPPSKMGATDKEIKEFQDHAANVRRAMRFADGPPAPAKRTKTKK